MAFHMYTMSLTLTNIILFKNIKVMTISLKNSLNFKISGQEHQIFISENSQDKCAISYFSALKVENKAKRSQ